MFLLDPPLTGPASISCATQEYGQKRTRGIANNCNKVALWLNQQVQDAIGAKEIDSQGMASEQRQIFCDGLDDL